MLFSSGQIKLGILFLKASKLELESYYSAWFVGSDRFRNNPLSLLFSVNDLGFKLEIKRGGQSNRFGKVIMKGFKHFHTRKVY